MIESGNLSIDTARPHGVTAMARLVNAVSSVRSPSPRIVVGAKWLLIVLGMLPLLRLSAGFPLGWLGANPIEFITRSTGTWTLVGLAVTLSITPLRKLLNWPWLVRLRRTAGLLAFFYACLHFTTYIWFDRKTLPN